MESGLRGLRQDDASTVCIEADALREHAVDAEQFDTPAAAKRAVARFLRYGRKPYHNVTSAIAEMLVLRCHPRAQPFRKDKGEHCLYEGTDFFVRGKRYQVKSVVRGNTKFLLSQEKRIWPLPHYFVFVRLWAFECSDRMVTARYDMEVLSRQKLRRVIVGIFAALVVVKFLAEVIYWIRS